jgi:hypothetical protein
MRLALPVRLHITEGVSGKCITVPMLVHDYQHSAGGHYISAYVISAHLDVHFGDGVAQIIRGKQRVGADGVLLQRADTNDVVFVVDDEAFERMRSCFTDISPHHVHCWYGYEPFRSLMYRIELASNDKVLKSYVFYLREMFVHYIGMTVHMTDVKSGVIFSMLFDELLGRASCGVRFKPIDRWIEYYDQISITETGALRIDASFRAVERFMQLLEFERRFEEGRKR